MSDPPSKSIYQKELISSETEASSRGCVKVQPWQVHQKVSDTRRTRFASQADTPRANCDS